MLIVCDCVIRLGFFNFMNNISLIKESLLEGEKVRDEVAHKSFNYMPGCSLKCPCDPKKSIPFFLWISKLC